MTSEERLARKRERGREWARQWRIDNPQLALAKDARQRAAVLADPVALARRRTTEAAWRSANPEKVLAAQERRTARRRTDPVLRADNNRRVREWREAHPDKLRAQVLARRGLTPDKYDAMLAAQGGRCAICQSTENGKRSRLDVDHDHMTGYVRGLLCNRCNQLLSNARDDGERLYAAIAYLESHAYEAVA